MDLTECQQREHLIKGLDYLRRHVIEYHRAGDGMQVLHYSTVALTRSIEFGKKNPEFKLKMHEISWAFIFGMYWLVHTKFLVLVADGFQHIDCEGDNHTDSQTIILIYNLLSKPELLIDLELVDEISTDWWSKRGSIERADIEEDFIAISFAIELIWCKFPLQKYWNKLFAKWIKTIPDKNCFRPYLEDLKKRLEYQTGFFTGKAFLDHAQSQLLIKDNIQRSLFEGWVAFYNLQFEELANRLQILRNQIGIGSNNFHPFFELINQSRIYLFRL